MIVPGAALLIVLLAAAAYVGFRRFRQRARAHLAAQRDIAWYRDTPAGLICAVLGYPLEVDLLTTFVYRWRRRAEEAPLFDELAAALRARVPPIHPPPFALVRDRILPLVRRTDGLPPPAGYRAENRLLVRPFDPELSVVYAIEGQFRITYVTEGMVRAWNAGPDALHDLAVANLRVRTHHILEEIGGRRADYVALDGYDAARILVADLIIPEGISDPLLAIPHEHACLVADAAQRESLAVRAEALFRAAQAPLTARLFDSRRIPTPSSGRAGRPAPSASSTAGQRSGYL